MLQEHEIISRMRDAFWSAGEKCEAVSRLGALGAGWMEISLELDALEGCARQMGHFRGDARWFRLAPLYVKAKETGRTLYLLNRWSDFRQFGMIFAQGLAQMQRLVERPTGKSGPILPKPLEPTRETVH